MSGLRLTEVLLPMIAARAWAPWATQPRQSAVQAAETARLELRAAAARLGGGLAHADAPRRLFDDIQ